MKTILLLHGMGGPNPLNKIEDGLKESGQYQIIKPVMPGFRSEDGIIEYTDEKYVEFIEKLRQKLGIETWIVLGYSMGGRTAMNYTFKYPQRVEKLILVDSVGIDYMIPPVKYKWGKPVLKKLLTPALRWGCIQEILGKGDFRDSKSKAYEIGKQWVSNMMKKVVVRKNFVEILTTIAKPIENIEEKLSNLKMKVLLINGSPNAKGCTFTA